jgi:serine/threonine protein kinase
MGDLEADRPSRSGRGARLGRYRIVRRIGHGSFGTVYEAVIRGSAGDGRRVAIKKLRAHVVNSEPEFIRSMANEARIGALLDHANVVRVLQFGRRRSHYYLAMDFVDGADLGQLIRACGVHGVGLPRFAVVDLARQIIRGLQHAHGLRDDEGNPTELVHRDIKPSNVLVDRQGIARVGDFGVARSSTNVDADVGAQVSLDNPPLEGSTVRYDARTASWNRFSAAFQSPDSVSTGPPPPPATTAEPPAGGMVRGNFARVGIAITVVLAIVVFAVVGTRLGPCAGAAEQDQNEGG